ncbi:MAG: hypothetical protein RIR62_2649 [Pseudomonadota bacterium]|jgi:hypothetical protein
MTDLSFSFVSVRMFAAGTPVRTGIDEDDFTPIEFLSAGDTVYDPVSGRFHDIADMSCGTLDRDKAREIGMEVYRFGKAQENRRVTCMIESRNMARGPLRDAPPAKGAIDEGVFYALAFDGRVIVDTGAALCEIR